MRLRSVVGERGKWSGGRREAFSASQPERNARRRAADGSPPLMAAHCGCPLVTSARFAEWSGRRREGDRDDGQPVERSKPRVGHGAHFFQLQIWFRENSSLAIPHGGLADNQGFRSYISTHLIHVFVDCFSTVATRQAGSENISGLSAGC